MLPTPRQAGFIIGNSLTHMPLTQLVEAFDEQVLAAAGVTLGKTYPKPIVDFKESRDAALAGYQRIREPAAE